jgi:hypothetical protein
MAAAPSPNPVAVGFSIIQARRVRIPRPTGPGSIDHGALAPVLADLEAGGVPALGAHRRPLAAYRDSLQSVDPDDLSPEEALAYWINLYNAGALDLAAEANVAGNQSVLRVKGGFQRPWAVVAGENLSLDAIEHGKIRRFGDPRIHGGLVCGSASCPTLRYEPFSGSALDDQLEDQMQTFLAGGGAIRDETAHTLFLSRIFLWYGADFTRPNRMPTLLPARRRAVADALGRWLDPGIETWRIATGPRIEFQPYDWSLACTIR